MALTVSPVAAEPTDETSDPGRVTPASRRLSAAGSERILWLSLAEWDGELDNLANRFWYRSADADSVRPAAFIPPQLDAIAKSAVAGQTLAVFFENGTHMRYDLRRPRRAHKLPDNRLPLALAGEQQGGQPVFWAIVTPEVEREIGFRWQARQPPEAETSPDDGAGAPVIGAPPDAEGPDHALHVARYDGTGWQPGIDLPSECGPSDGLWLAVADGRFHLLWQEAGGSDEVRYACHADGEWTTGPAIAAGSDVHRAAAAVVNKQLVFAALVKSPADHLRRCLRWMRPVAADNNDPWYQPAALLDDNGNELALTTRAAVGLFSDRLALLREGADGPQVAFWVAAKGGRPETPFEPLVMLPAQERPATRNVREFIVTMAVAAVLLLVFWRRQDAIAAPLPLPVGLRVAGPGKRMLAFLLDAAPAAVVVAWWWHEPLSAFYHEVNAAAAAGVDQRVQAPAAVMWSWFWFRVIYTTYTVLFELTLSSTPGKRLFGCTVLSETLERPTALQVGIRNVTRMVELEPFLHIWPFLIVFFFTRNRQRLGDLLARTVVVERHPVLLLDNEEASESREEM